MGHKSYGPDDQQKMAVQTGFTESTYAAGLILLSFKEQDLQLIYVKSDSNNRMMSYQDVGLPFGKEDEEDKGVISRTVRREFAQETRTYPRVAMTHAFTLNRPHDRKIGEKFPNHFLYAWEDGVEEIKDEVIFKDPSSTERTKEGRIEIVPKDRVSQMWKVSFSNALSPALRPQHRLAAIELYYLMKAGKIKGHEEELTRYMEKKKLDLIPTYEAFLQPSIVEQEKGIKYFRTLVVKDNCSYVLDPSSIYHCDFLTPKPDSATKKLIWFEHKGKLYDPKEQLLLKV